MPVPPLGRFPLGAALTIALSVVALAGVTGLLREEDNAAAQTAGTPVTRVVFAIDNSGSMFGVGGEPASDPDEQRIAGVRSLIEVLQGFLGSPDEQRVVELAALSFGGDEPQVLSRLDDVLSGRLADRLRAEQADRGTDFRAALCGAWTLATREEPPPGAGCPEPSSAFLNAAGEGGGQTSDDADARLLVVLITDGSPAPDGSDLAFDGAPPADGCADDFTGYDAGDGDAYLCSLAETWRVLRAERSAELAVIGLDEPGQWFPDAEPYWQRVAQCGDAGQPDCTDRVVRSLDPDDLAEWILRTFPGVDLCEAIRGEPFNCDVPGGLVSVRFQIVGLAADSASRVVSPDRIPYDSTEDPAELTRLGAATHLWRFEQPGAGVWAVTGALDPARRARVIVDPDPARFDIALRGWDGDGMGLELTLHPTSSGRVAVASLLTQPYRVQLLRGGATVGEETVRLDHAGGDDFTLTASSFTAPDDEEAVYEYEVALYLRTLLVGRASLNGPPPPEVDLCEAIRDEIFNCDVPGGLVSVRFQIAGLAADSASAAVSPDQVAYDSADDPAELTRLDATTHVWRFERPRAGVWALTGALDSSRRARVTVDPDPARFDITLERWDERGMTLDLRTAAEEVALPFLLTQPYRVQLLRRGATVGEETVLIEHAGGDAFTLNAASFTAPADGDAVYEVALYLRTLLVGRADALPPSPQVACLAEWAGESGVAPRWQPALRLGFPLPVRFRDSAIWSATVVPAECAEVIEAEADVPGCDACTTSGTGPPPLTLDVPTDGLPGGVVERRVSWYVPSSGVEDAQTEEVVLSDSAFLATEPYWATALHLLALALLLGGISAAAVRMPLQWREGEEPARPIDLFVPDERFREVRIVRLGIIVWRRVGQHQERDEPGRLLTLRWVFFGPLVARDTGEDAPGRARWLGTPAAEVTAAEANRLDLRRAPRRRGAS